MASSRSWMNFVPGIDRSQFDLNDDYERPYIANPGRPYGPNPDPDIPFSNPYIGRGGPLDDPNIPGGGGPNMPSGPGGPNGPNGGDDGPGGFNGEFNVPDHR